MREYPVNCRDFAQKLAAILGRVTGWLGREGSNLRMAESKSAALPLGYAPSGCCRNGARKPTLRHRRSIEGVRLFQQARPLNSGKNGPAAPVSICSCLYIVAG